ncbi:MAG TPA: outer membrane protein assembly factor BamA, partial [Vicinamibacteria bacterium]|nr:outer membrane protein assembly factor BamA [Vicinamibacteria bacterium]
GAFDSVEVEEETTPGGVRLRFRVSRQPFLEQLDYSGDLGLSPPDVAAAAGLALGGPADQERLERARVDVVTRLRKEGYLGGTAKLDVRANPATNGRTVTMMVAAGPQARVRNVTIAGLVHAEGKPLYKALGLDEGDGFRDRTLHDGVRAVEDKLHEEGFFEARVTAREPAWDAATHRVDIVVQVVEGPQTIVEFSGRDALSEKALREHLTFADSRIVDDVEVRASADQLEKTYHEAGYAFAHVTGTLGGDPPQRTVRFTIEEGPRVFVEAITLEGASPKLESKLRDQMRTHVKGLSIPGRPRGLYVEETLTDDMRALRRYLVSQGYPQAQVGPPRTTFSEDRTTARIVIPVAEGPRRTMGAVTIAGNRVLTTEQILKVVGLRAGDGWDEAKLDEARRKIEQLYQRRGYQGTTVAAQATETGERMTVVFDVTEAELTRVGRVMIAGLTATKTSVVERELQMKPGDPLDAVDLSETRRRLDATRIFDRVDVEVLGTPDAPFRDVVVRVREAKPWRIEFGGGYATEEGLRGYVTLGNDNLFGTGQSASITERVSEKSERTEVQYRQPWLFGTPWQGEAAIFRERKHEIGFDSDSRGATYTVTRELLSQLFRPEEPTDHPKNLRGGLRYRIEEFRRHDIDPALAEGAVPRDDTVGSFMPFLALELRDNPTDPHGGSYHFASVEVGSSALGGTVNFVKFVLENSVYLGLPYGTVLALGGRLGMAAPFGGTQDLVIEDRFKAGGSTTIRGYKFELVGPVDEFNHPEGGDLRILFNVEYRFPIWRFLGGVTFFDAGMVTPRVRDFAWDQFYPGAGGGLRLATPIGPVRFDVGYALRQLRNDDRLQFYVTVGHAF